MLVALDAEMVVRGPGGVRNVAAGDFFKGLFEPDLATDEVLTEIRVPKTAGRGWSYLKFHRRAQDWALVGVAALAQNGGGPSVALTNMADRRCGRRASRRRWPAAPIPPRRRSVRPRARARRPTRSRAPSTAGSS